MGILNKTSVYLAGPIQFTKDSESWRDMVTQELHPLGIKIFNPLCKPFLDPKYLEGKEDQIQMDNWAKEGKLDLIAEKMHRVRNSDLAVCDRATFGIFYLNPEIYTVGTIEELTTMNRRKAPCFVLWDSDKPCYWVLGMLKASYVYRTWDKLVGMIKDIDSGKVELDSNRWKLFTEDLR